MMALLYWFGMKLASELPLDAVYSHVLFGVKAGKDRLKSRGKFLQINGAVAILVQATHELENLTKNRRDGKILNGGGRGQVKHISK